MTKRSASTAPVARRRKSGRTTRPDDASINFADIPELSENQLRSMRRIGRPPLGDTTRQMIAMRVDPKIIAAFREEAERRQIGYQTLIHEVLEAHVKRTARRTQRDLATAGGR